MIQVNYKYRNKYNKTDIVYITSIEHIDGIKTVVFYRSSIDSSFKLPIEMFEMNFERL
jgi:hypothetical protein